jgi:shikimate kinase
MTSCNQGRPSRQILPIALTGFMAAGKSTAGRALAWLLRWRFIDLDYEIERRARASIREIFRQEGEKKFREIETEALRLVLQSYPVSTVIALGGGTFVQPACAELLHSSSVRVVFLKLRLEELLQRCRTLDERSEQNPRPLAEDEDAFRVLYARRLSFYEQADLVVHAEEKTPEQIANEIAQAFGLHLPGGRESHTRP